MVDHKIIYLTKYGQYTNTSAKLTSSTKFILFMHEMEVADEKRALANQKYQHMYLHNHFILSIPLTVYSCFKGQMGLDFRLRMALTQGSGRWEEGGSQRTSQVLIASSPRWVGGEFSHSIWVKTKLTER